MNSAINTSRRLGSRKEAWMTPIKQFFVTIVLLLLSSLWATAQAPSISSLSVTSGITGTAVTISGANFGSSAGTVTFNGSAATINSWTSGSIGVTVPAPATTGNVVVTVGGVASNGVSFTVLPNITGLLVNGVPSSSGPIGSTVTINGTGFGATIGFNTVSLNTVALAGNGVRATSWSDQSIVVVIPSTATSGNIIVKIEGHNSNGAPFTIGPVITSVSPTSGVAGTGIAIQGSGFGTSTGTVSFNGMAATVSGWGQNSILAQVPYNATVGPVSVTVAGVSSNGMAFTPTPAITSLSPNFGLSGAQVVIAGSSFGNQQGSSAVTFNGTSASVTAWNNNSITVNAPVGALTGSVVVTVNGVNSAGATFTYTPVISSVSPSLALAQTPVTLAGNNFGASQGASTVTFNGVPAAVSSWTNTSIGVIVPGNASGGPVVVTVNGVVSNGVPFAYPPPYAFNLSYLPDGNVSSAQDTVNGNWTYAYDDFGRLASSAHSSSQQAFSYTYDQYGNRWQQNVTAGSGGTSVLTFTAASSATTNGNCYHAAGLNNQPDGYCYDAAGNLLSDGQHTYTYDAEGHIIKVDGGQTATYIYDGGGQRVQKITATTSSSFLYDPDGHVIAEINAFGAWIRTEVYLGGRHLATYSNGSSGNTYLIQADWTGSERARVLPSGDTFETCISLPFGDGQNCNGSADPSPDHFTGKERDAESSLDDFGARHYTSAMGRFMSPDPAGILAAKLTGPQTFNRYSYALNTPVTAIDPDGLDCVYLNSAATAVRQGNGIDQSIDSPGCMKTGGYWIDGAVTNVSIDSAKNVIWLEGTTNGKDRTSIGHTIKETLTVGWFQNTNLNPFGHIAISVSNSVVGITDYNALPVGLNPASDGQFTRSVLGYAALYCLGHDCRYDSMSAIMYGLEKTVVPGAILPQTGTPVQTIDISVTGPQARAMDVKIYEDDQNPPNYSIFGPKPACDCGTWAQQVMGAAGLPSGHNAPIPETLMRQLVSIYGPK